MINNIASNYEWMDEESLTKECEKNGISFSTECSTKTGNIESYRFEKKLGTMNEWIIIMKNNRIITPLDCPPADNMLDVMEFYNTCFFDIFTKNKK